MPTGNGSSGDRPYGEDAATDGPPARWELPPSLNDQPVTGRTGTEPIEPAHLHQRAAELFGRGYRLALVAAHHGTGDTADGGPGGAAIRVVYLFVAGPPDSRIELRLSLGPDAPARPSLAGLSYPAGRFEREMRDLYGVMPLGHARSRRPHSVRADAGPIEPGRFRSAEELLHGHAPDRGVALAERVSGDTGVGHALAYCLAVEDATDVEVPPEAARMRAIPLELERLHNHVTDLGALCDDAGHSILHAHAVGIRETLLHINHDATGHRLLRGGIVLGGAALRRVPDPSQPEAVGADVRELAALALSHTGVHDRFAGTAVLTPERARDLGTVGYVARASGLDHDARVSHPFTDFAGALTVPTRTSGDVLARFLIRADEIDVSVDLVTELGRGLNPGYVTNRPPFTDTRLPNAGTGIVEGRRGTITHRVELDPDGYLSHVKIADPSFFNGPAVPLALQDAIDPDFPLAGKSFNLCYAGNGL